jgi:hypothetical protein
VYQLCVENSNSLQPTLFLFYYKMTATGLGPFGPSSGSVLILLQNSLSLSIYIYVCVCVCECVSVSE